jgi:hypothetical protein
MKKLFDQKFINGNEMCWDKLFSGYELFVDKHYVVIYGRLSNLFICFDEMKEWKREVNAHKIMKTKERSWDLTEFAEKEDRKDDDKEILI